jgi:hypothetical protein
MLAARARSGRQRVQPLQRGARERLGIQPARKRAPDGIGGVLAARRLEPVDDRIHHLWIDERTVGRDAHDRVGP